VAVALQPGPHGGFHLPELTKGAHLEAPGWAAVSGQRVASLPPILAMAAGPPMADRTRSLEAIGAAYISLGSLNVCHKNRSRIYLARLLGTHHLATSWLLEVAGLLRAGFGNCRTEGREEEDT